MNAIFLLSFLGLSLPAPGAPLKMLVDDGFKTDQTWVGDALYVRSAKTGLGDVSIGCIVDKEKARAKLVLLHTRFREKELRQKIEADSRCRADASVYCCKGPQATFFVVAICSGDVVIGESKAEVSKFCSTFDSGGVGAENPTAAPDAGTVPAKDAGVTDGGTPGTPAGTGNKAMR